ncbi:MAG: hemerythrin domain-containing protein [Candidatus Scalindua sp.]
MSVLIEEFKREHSEILAILNEVKELGILSKAGQVKLMSIKASLLEHLWNENERIYPVLWKEAEHNKDLKELLDLFAIEMEDVSKVAQQFFNKFHEGTIDKSFPHEFEAFFAAITKRIKNEEDILYEEYEKIDQ